MKRLHFQAAIARLQVDVTERPQSEPTARFEAVQEAVFRSSLGQFLLVGPEGFPFDWFEREFNLIVNATAAFELVAAFALQDVRHEPPPLRERMLGRCGYFGKRDAVILPGNDVAC